jgi:predicted flap endonuclease-1-like 5' DNA nuclease
MWFLARDLLVWLLLAVALGISIGWLWWGTRVWAARSRGASPSGAPVEQQVIDLRQRTRELDGVRAERNQWEAQSRAQAFEIEQLRLQPHGAAVAVAPVNDVIVEALRERVAELERICAAYASVEDDTPIDSEARLQRAVLDLVSLRAAVAEREEANQQLHADLAEARKQLVQHADQLAESEREGANLRTEVGSLREQVDALTGEDDFELIEGLGSRAAVALRGNGIRTFAQLEAADPDALRKALETGGVGFLPSLASWPSQAARLRHGLVDDDRAPVVRWREPGVDR